MRIIAGKHRGRKLLVPEGKSVRPTTGKTREAIFNILLHNFYQEDGTPLLIGARVADIYSGSGAFGAEALSRGAGFVTFVDSNRDSLHLARQNIQLLREQEAAEFLRTDATQLPTARQPYDIIFMDPPYHAGLITRTLESLQKQGWLKQETVILVEHSVREACAIPPGMEAMEERRYGNTMLTEISPRMMEAV